MHELMGSLLGGAGEVPLHPVRLRNEGSRWQLPEGKTLRTVSWGNVYPTGLQGT